MLKKKKKIKNKTKNKIVKIMKIKQCQHGIIKPSILVKNNKSNTLKRELEQTLQQNNKPSCNPLIAKMALKSPEN
jgi:hypothetical protein